MTTHYERAAKVADRLRAFAQKVDALAWSLDEELSAIDKDEAGYRQANGANPDGAANAVPGDLEKALFQAEAFLHSLGHAEHAFNVEHISCGGTYGQIFSATLAGWDAAWAHVKAQQLAGRVVPLKVAHVDPSRVRLG